MSTLPAAPRPARPSTQWIDPATERQPAPAADAAAERPTFNFDERPPVRRIKPLPSAPDEYIDTTPKHPDEIYVEIEAGARLIVNSLIWHSGTENESGDRRRVTFTEYRRRDLPQLLSQQVYLSGEVKQELNEAQRWLLSVGPEFPVDKSRHYGPGDAYRRRYPIASANEMTV